MKPSLIAVGLALCLATAGRAAVIISEVHPTGSANLTYGADFFELTNTGAAAVDITGWKMDDNSNTYANAVALRGITSISAGQSVVFAEGNTSGSNDGTIQTNFIAAWFGGTAPTGFTMGGYGGSGVGLSATSDAVNIYDSGGVLVTRVDLGAATTGVTFDNAAGLNNVTLSSLSVAGITGAFVAPSGEIGSPGTIAAAAPEPATLAVMGAAALCLIGRRRRLPAR